MLQQRTIDFETESVLVLYEGSKYGDEPELISVVWGGVDLMALPEGWLRPGLLERVGDLISE